MMPPYKPPRLGEDIKLELLHCLFSNRSPGDVLPSLSPEEIVSAHQFIWEKTIEFGIRSRGKNFSQDELISYCQKNTVPVPEACRNKPHLCYSIACLLQQRDCALPRISAQIDCLCKMARAYLTPP
jgi:hypothetical protein